MNADVLDDPLGAASISTGGVSTGGMAPCSCRARCVDGETMTTADDYGHAGRHLEALRADLAAANFRLPIRFGGYGPSGAHVGEYRFQIGPGYSVYVQAPVTPAGRPRQRHPGRWRYKPYGPCPWRYAANRRAVVAAILALARQYWDGTGPAR